MAAIGNALEFADTAAEPRPRAGAGAGTAGRQRVRRVAGDPRGAGPGVASPRAGATARARRGARTRIGGTELVHVRARAGTDHFVEVTAGAGAAVTRHLGRGSTVYLDDMNELLAAAPLLEIVRRCTAPMRGPRSARGCAAGRLGRRAYIPGPIWIEAPSCASSCRRQRQRTEDIALPAVSPSGVRRYRHPQGLLLSVPTLAALPAGQCGRVEGPDRCLAVVVTRGVAARGRPANVRLEGAERLEAAPGRCARRANGLSGTMWPPCFNGTGPDGRRGPGARHRTHQSLPEDQTAEHSTTRSE